MSQIAQEVEQLETEFAAAEERKQQLAGQDPMEYERAVNEHNRIAAVLSDKRAELQQHQEREQKVQEVNETNSDIAIEVFNALVPDPKPFEMALGLNEFSGWRTDFYQLFDGALADRTKLMTDQHTYELAQKDEKIRALNVMVADIEQELDEQRRVNGELSGKLQLLQIEHDNSNDAVMAERDSHAETRAELSAAQTKIAELEAKLAAQKPKQESKPSQAFADRMNEIRTKNEARIKSAAELALENLAPFRGKVTVTESKQQESPFRGENNSAPATYLGNDQILDAPPVGGEQFQTLPIITPALSVTPAGDVPGQQLDGEVAEEAATKAWVMEQLDALRKEVFGEQVA